MHESLHHASLFARLADGRSTADDHVGLLCVMWRFHASMITACDRGARALGMPQLAAAQHARLDRLQRDLAHVGADVPSPCPSPDCPSPATAVGALYAVLGSMLGGAVLHRQLGRVSPGQAGREFFARSAEEGRVWQEYCVGLEAYGAERHRQPALIAGATKAFGHFRACLEGTA